jgi:hypothetical protein
MKRMHEGILFINADTRSESAGNPDAPPRTRDTFISNKAATNVHAVDADGYMGAFYLYPPNTKIIEVARAD